MKLESRDGVEYEFTTVLDIVHDGHFAVASKDRTGIFSGDPKPISEATGKAFAEWLAGGQASAPAAPSELAAKAAAAIGKASTEKDLEKCRKALDQYLAAGSLTTEEWSTLTDSIDSRLVAVGN
jgi:hypothetical protein